MTFHHQFRTLAATALGLGLLASGAAAQPSGDTIAIVGATVFDATGAAPRVANVLIRDGRITAVGADVAAQIGRAHV